MSEPVLEVRDLVKHFPVPRSRGGGVVHAVDGVDLAVQPGEVVGLVGESGSGKSTVGKCIVRLLEPTSGSIRLHGQDVTHLKQRRLRSLRRSWRSTTSSCTSRYARACSSTAPSGSCTPSTT
jgi:ABC-type oligopeptide transport system ATPase subunit